NPYKSTTYKDHEKTTWEEKIVRSGAKSIKITNTNPEDNPFVKQTIDVYGGGKYQVGAYFYAEEFGAGGFVTIKVEFYDDAANFLGEGNIRYNGAATQTWTPLASTFEVPAGVTKMAVLLRLRQRGTIYFDDIQVVSTEKPTPIFIETDEVFYYTDHTDPGYAVATLNSKAYPALASVTAVDMRLKKGDTVLAESLNVPVVDGTASFYYDVALLTEKQTEYKIEVTTSGLVGEALIYKYDRPLYLDARGVYRDASGQVIYPVTAYRYRDYQYEIGNKEGGITVGQLAMPADKEGDALVAYLKDYLDKAVAANTKCMIALYRNGKPAGDPVNIATTELVVAALKDHPGLYAWMVMDETFNNVPNPHDVLRRSYIAIRNNDPYHPVYMCEATTRLVEAGRYCDILCVDPYPGNHDAPEHFPADRVKLAIESVKGRKPVYSLLQCIDFQEYTPTTDELRNMIYQSLLAGADAIGYYKFDDSLETTDLNETHFWDAIKPFAQNEQVDAFKAFVYDEYNIFSDVRNEKAWCISYIKNNEIYMVVQNRTKEAQTLQIPLTSIAGDVTVGDYTATCIAGGNGETVTGNGTLTAQVVKSGVSLYKITPADASVLATIPQTRFHDIREYGWAYNAILRTDAAGIVNGISDDSFFPGQKITRGDFAMFLIRTLGLTADATETFADVNASAHYAKEIAIGKALGILKGVGNDLYMPEAEISRQDLMVICARGMRLKKALEESGDISQFSDAASIADYAVADIAAMTRASIVKGYEDGSIRPLGNTTRAEAAVIMDRIMNWAA
ncbi:MAG: S-layer homology domain-containing protein, partial [Clostridia bacterium]|nr:S-layer homology domain-containing protein [Clostridia bacterium]